MGGGYTVTSARPHLKYPTTMQGLYGPNISAGPHLLAHSGGVMGNMENLYLAI